MKSSVAMLGELQKWDGKSARDITAIYSQYCDQPDFVDMLIQKMTHVELQAGLSWLLKHHLETGTALNSNQANKIFLCLPTLDPWQAKLHILQSLPFLIIDKSVVQILEKFLNDTLTDENKFVRAWSYNGYYELACQYPQYQKRASAFFELAMRDEAASVKARIRAILKKGF